MLPIESAMQAGAEPCGTNSASGALRSAGRSLAAAAAALALAPACGPGQGALPRWPAGALVLAEVPALRALLDRVALDPGTPAGQRAVQLRRGLPGCDLAFGLDPGGDLLRAVESLDCTAKAPAPLEALRAGHAIALALPASALAPGGARGAAGGQPLRARLDVDAVGGVALELWLPQESVSRGLALLLPGGDPPGPAVLSPRGALVRARVRPSGGLSLSQLVPQASQADRLFHLRSALFSELVLDGSWELAVYLPEAPSHWPQISAALGVRSRSAAEQALDTFLEGLARSWPLPRREVDFSAGPGVCLPELRLLPELAPCAVVGESALFLAWNRTSLEHALEAPAGEAGGDAVGISSRPAALDVDLSLVPEADALLAGAAPEGAPASARAAAGWRRLTAGGGESGSDYSLWARLEASGSPGLAQGQGAR